MANCHGEIHVANLVAGSLAPLHLFSSSSYVASCYGDITRLAGFLSMVGKVIITGRPNMWM